jgi:hypothetical protein
MGYGGLEMQKFEELLAIFRSPDYRARFLQAKATSTCVFCGKPAQLFRDTPASFEYTISALCQDCQDKYFRRTVDPQYSPMTYPLAGVWTVSKPA